MRIFGSLGSNDEDHEGENGIWARRSASGCEAGRLGWQPASQPASEKQRDSQLRIPACLGSVVAQRIFALVKGPA